MAGQNIELSKDGIKLPYRRFLTDSATGYVVILMLFIVYHFSSMGRLINSYSLIAISENEKIFFFLLIFLLATPVGITINALSWLTLEWTQSSFAKSWVEKKYFFLNSIKSDHLFKNSVEFYGINKDNWDDVNNLVRRVVKNNYPDRSQSIDYVTGVKIFVRNLAFLCGITAIYFICCPNLKLFLLATVLFTFFTIFFSIISFYEDTYVLFLGFSLCVSFKDIERAKGNYLEIVRLLQDNIHQTLDKAAKTEDEK